MAKPWKIIDLDPSESLKVCLRKIAQTRFQETFSYEHGTVKGEDIESLHDMRVSARRLRAVLRIFRECFPKKKFRKQDERLHALIRSLGAVRERDVFLDLLSNYRKTLTPRDGRVIDLLLARQSSARLGFRKQLQRDLRTLARIRYPDSFNQFLKESL